MIKEYELTAKIFKLLEKDLGQAAKDLVKKLGVNRLSLQAILKL